MGHRCPVAVWPSVIIRQRRRCHERAPDAGGGHGRGSGSPRRMIGAGSAHRRMSRVWRLLIGLQVSLLVFALVAPAGTMAADPSDPPASPPPSEEPSAPPPPDPSPTAEPSAEPTAEPPGTPGRADPGADLRTDCRAHARAHRGADPGPDARADESLHRHVRDRRFRRQPGRRDRRGRSDLHGHDRGPSHACRERGSQRRRCAQCGFSRVARVEPDRSRATEADPSDPGYASTSGRCRRSAGRTSTAPSPRRRARTSPCSTPASTPRTPDLAGKLVAGRPCSTAPPRRRPERPRHRDGRHHRGRDRQRQGHRRRRLRGRHGHAGQRARRRRHRPGQRHHRGRRLGADHGADVILMSFSQPGLLGRAAGRGRLRLGHGVVLVAATGNDGSSPPTFPAGDRGSSASRPPTRPTRSHASSNYGADTFLAAPGVGHRHDWPPAAARRRSPARRPRRRVVAGAAALLRAADPAASNGVIVGRLARTADAAGTAAETGNGRLNLARAVADTSTDSVEPAGAAPVGDGGPFVGPYVAAGSGVVAVTVRDAVTNALISGANVTCTSNCTGARELGYDECLRRCAIHRELLWQLKLCDVGGHGRRIQHELRVRGCRQLEQRRQPRDADDPAQFCKRYPGRHATREQHCE